MFAFFRGTVDYLSESEVWLDVNGVGYEIAISPSTASRLQGFGSEEVTVYTYMMVHEDQIGLYGFLTRDELMLFKKLITVSGVGPKAGLSLLSVLDADDLRFAIASGDVKAISRAPGVGRRTAERLILELKDKINAAAPAAAQEAGEEPGITGRGSRGARIRPGGSRKGRACCEGRRNFRNGGASQRSTPSYGITGESWRNE